MLLKNIRNNFFPGNLLSHSIIKPIGIFLITFGCKLWLIHTTGMSCPFWDEWDVEARALYKPFIENNLPWLNLFSPHNEHRLFMPRLLGLLLLKLNHLWDPKLQMITNSGVASITAVMIYVWFRKIITNRYQDWFLVLLILAVFASPIGWENSLMGLQSQVYFLVLFSFLSIRFFSQFEPLTSKWSLGILFSIAAYFSLASGFLPGMVAVALIIVKALTTRTLNRRWVISSVILLCLVILGYLFTPSLGGYLTPTLSSLWVLLTSFLKLLAGPNYGKLWPAIVIWLPFIAFLIHIVLKRKDPSKQDMFILGFGFLILLQAAALAYGRGNYSGIAVRYYDLLLPGILINFIAIVKLLNLNIQNMRQWQILYAAVWSFLIISGFWSECKFQITRNIKIRREMSAIQLANVKGYIATGDFGYLNNKPRSHIPYPPQHSLPLKELLDDPTIRSILPSSIRYPLSGQVTENQKEAFVDNGYDPKTPLLLNERIHGSYGKLKEKQQGKIVIRYSNNKGFGWVRIPIAGYPSEEGQSLKLFTKGGEERKLFYLSKNPGVSWSSAYARVHEKEFTIEAEDNSEKYWLALADPKKEGRLMVFAEFILKSWVEFVRPGVIILLISFFYLVFKDERDKHIV